MNFSDSLPHSSFACFSPDGRSLAVVKGLHLNVLAATDLSPLAQFTLLDQTTDLQWSDDCSLLLCAQGRRSILQVFSLQDDTWTAKINLGEAGLAKARWAPDGRRVITVTEMQIRLSVWSLVDKSVYHIRNPKFGNEQGLEFSHDGRFMALLERHSGRDFLGVYSTSDFSLQRVQSTQHIVLDSSDAVDVRWTSTDSELVIWESPVDCAILIYSASRGTLVVKREVYQGALGVKSLRLSPNGFFLAAGMYDQTLRVFGHISWRQVLSCKHSTSISVDTCTAYREAEYRDADDGRVSSHYVLASSAVELSPLKIPPDRASPPIGVSLCEWSAESKFLATRNGNHHTDNTPNVVWVWDVTTLALKSALVHFDPVRTVAWAPRSETLAIATGTNRVYLWTATGASVCDVPVGTAYIESREFAVSSLRWSNSGDALLLMDKASLLVAYPHFQTSD